MEVIQISVAEFRKNVRVYLDQVIQGRVVIIDRLGQRFMLTYLPREIDFIIGLEKNIAVSPEGKE